MNTKSINKLEIGASFLLLSTYIGTFSVRQPIMSDGKLIGITSPSIIELVLGDLAYIIIPILILLRWKQFLFVVTRDIFPLLISLIVILSISWSVISNEIVNDVMGLVRTIIFAAYLATRYKRQDLMTLLAWSLGITAIFSVFVVLFVPGYGIYDQVYWSGIFGHKNHLGAPMALSSVIFFSLAFSRSKYKKLLWTFFVISSCLVFLSGSGGAIVNCVITISLIPLSKFIKKSEIRKQILLFNFGLISCSLLSFLLIVNAEGLLGLLGKDLTFTGRTRIWPVVIHYIRQKPLLGYGYASFWRSEYGDVFRDGFFWEEIPHSHNGFLEILLGLGILGFIIFVASFFIATFRAIHIAYLSKTVEELLPIQLLVFIFIANSSEATLLSSNNIFLIVYISILLSLAVEIRYLALAKKRLHLKY